MFPNEVFSLTAEVEAMYCEMRPPKYRADILTDYIELTHVVAGNF